MSLQPVAAMGMGSIPAWKLTHAMGAAKKKKKSMCILNVIDIAKYLSKNEKTD